MANRNIVPFYIIDFILLIQKIFYLLNYLDINYQKHIRLLWQQIFVALICVDADIRFVP